MKLSTSNLEYSTEGAQLGRLNVKQDWPGSSQSDRPCWFVFNGFEMSVWDRSKKAMGKVSQRKKMSEKLLQHSVVQNCPRVRVGLFLLFAHMFSLLLSTQCVYVEVLIGISYAIIPSHLISFHVISHLSSTIKIFHMQTFDRPIATTGYTLYTSIMWESKCTVHTNPWQIQTN